MMAQPAFRQCFSYVLALCIVGVPVSMRGLVTLNDGHDRIYVNGNVSMGRDSNIFTNSDNIGDYVYTSALSAEYTRRAGWISVNGRASVTSSRFASLKGQDFNNPSLGLEFNKQSGRTTGTLTLSATRESRADAAVNTRSTSWNVPVGLNLKYPISGTYTLVTGFDYMSRKYLDEEAFKSLRTYSASIDLIHVWTNERDISAAYRYRHSQTGVVSSNTDHMFSLGLTGKLIRGINGSLKLGYQHSTSEGPARLPPFNGWTISSPVTFPFGSKRLNLSGSFAKDLTITATGAIVDTTTVTFDTKYVPIARWTILAALVFGDSRYLGESGRVVLAPGPPAILGARRHDDYITASTSLNYSLSEKLKASLAYSWFKNWSTISYGDFVRASWTMTASTRW